MKDNKIYTRIRINNLICKKFFGSDFNLKIKHKILNLANRRITASEKQDADILRKEGGRLRITILHSLRREFEIF